MHLRQIIHQIEHHESRSCQIEFLWQQFLYPKPSELRQFSHLPSELQDKIWQYALPTEKPLEVKVQLDDQSKSLFVLVVGLATMLATCKRSRTVALSVYEPRFQLFASYGELARVVLSHLNYAHVEAKEHFKRYYVYTRKEHPTIDIMPGSSVHSITIWEEGQLGFSKLSTVDTKRCKEAQQVV